MTETTAPAGLDFLLARLEAARTSPESFDLDGLLGEAVTALGRWDALKAFLDTEVADLRAEMETETVLMRRNLQRQARVLTQVREHMDEMEEGR